MSQDQNNRRILVRAPITLSIAPVPGTVTKAEESVTFGIANFQRILKDKGISCKVDADQALATVVDGVNPAVTYTANGLNILEERAYRVQINGEKHDLEFSTDLGNTFSVVGTFEDEGLANTIGAAWMDGRIESVG